MLAGVYEYWGHEADLEAITSRMVEVEPGGGTLAVTLACDAIRNSLSAVVYTCNMGVFDPTWFRTGDSGVEQSLREQLATKGGERLRQQTEAYLEYLRLGGELVFADLNQELVRECLCRGLPIIAGISSTYLNLEERTTTDGQDDDVRGEPAGHFVVLAGYRDSAILIADPGGTEAKSRQYWCDSERVIAAVLLGVITHDANLLVLQPP
jgi:hypothetical protein